MSDCEHTAAIHHVSRNSRAYADELHAQMHKRMHTHASCMAALIDEMERRHDRERRRVSRLKLIVHTTLLGVGTAAACLLTAVPAGAIPFISVSPSVAIEILDRKLRIV